MFWTASRPAQLPLDPELASLLDRFHRRVERVAIELQFQSLNGLRMLERVADRVFQRIAQADRGANLADSQRCRVIAPLKPAMTVDLDEPAQRRRNVQGQAMLARPL